MEVGARVRLERPVPGLPFGTVGIVQWVSPPARPWGPRRSVVEWVNGPRAGKTDIVPDWTLGAV